MHKNITFYVHNDPVFPCQTLQICLILFMQVTRQDGKMGSLANVSTYSQTCVQRPPLGLKQSGRCSKVKAKWLLFTVYSNKIAISFEKLGIKLAIADRWPLQTGGHCSEVVVNTGLTVLTKIGQTSKYLQLLHSIVRK